MPTELAKLMPEERANCAASHIRAAMVMLDAPNTLVDTIAGVNLENALAAMFREAERAVRDDEREGCAKSMLKYMATYPKAARADICSLSHIAAGAAEAIRARKEEER